MARALKIGELCVFVIASITFRDVFGELTTVVWTLCIEEMTLSQRSKMLMKNRMPAFRMVMSHASGPLSNTG